MFSPAVRRRILYVVLFEIVALVGSNAALLALGFSLTSGIGLSLSSSLIATTWNFVYNSGFEKIENRFGFSRTFAVRISHMVGFEFGIMIFCVPVMAFWLDISLVQAFMTNLIFMASFAVYVLVFGYIFDHFFPPVVSSEKIGQHPVDHSREDAMV